MEARIDLARMSDSQLLRTRVCDLKLSVHATPVESWAGQLLRERVDGGFRGFRPVVYLGDEWFAPDRMPAISVPFYLAHPRLEALEKKLIHAPDGGNRGYCMRLLRH